MFPPNVEGLETDFITYKGAKDSICYFRIVGHPFYSLLLLFVFLNFNDVYHS